MKTDKDGTFLEAILDEIGIDLDEISEAQQLSPYPYDEESISGYMPNPQADDNLLDVLQDFGLYLDTDEEHPTELDLAGEVNRNERERHGWFS